MSAFSDHLDEMLAFIRISVSFEYSESIPLDLVIKSSNAGEMNLIEMMRQRKSMTSRSSGPDVSNLENMGLSELRQAWIDAVGLPVPKVSATILRLALAFQFQATEFGGFSRNTIARMDMLLRSGRVNLPLQPGMRLIREWEGKLHVITVDEAGHIIWEGQRRRSLSAVARAITGTRWSGPAFFGLTQRSSAA